MCRSLIDAAGRRLWRVLACGGAVALWWMLTPAPASADQLASLVSPGALARAHRSVDGVANCSSCHVAGRKVTPEKCLACHQPIADRILRRVGVHRDAGTGCVSCHTEHTGEDADLRRLNPKTFDHAKDTGFALDGVHAKTAANCATCHKRRSFLEARTACVSCHADVHKPTLGNQCTNCHSTTVPFKAARTAFNHATTRFPLTGAHAPVACESCHKNGALRGVAFATCASCHTDPHNKQFGPTCSSCHTTERWSTRRVEHSRTGFPLVGAHARVTCVGCHVSGSMTAAVRFDTCSACHTNVHRTSVKGDCRECHNETSFRGAPFDHLKQTRFALDGAHQPLACAKCHTSVSPPDVPLSRKVVDYSGASRECVACHGAKDPHKGEFGRECQSCHRTATFDVKAFTHAGEPSFYRGFHEKVTCDRCHVPSRTPLGSGSSPPTPACASCHRDVHLGQVGAACESCHAVDGAHFSAVRFTHTASAFPLTGRHTAIECVACHKTETRAFATGHGTAMVLKPMDFRCQSCHADVHLGQVDSQCETCHKTTEFAMPTFTHKGLDDFFAGFHGKYACAACHKKETGVFPSGRGTAVRFIVGRTCIACHPK